MTAPGHDLQVDDARFGRSIRAIRVEARMRQVDLARRAGLSQAAISDIERGRGDRLSLRTLRAVASVLGAEASIDLRWRGGEVDRLLDQGHASLVAIVVDTLETAGWRTATEATYSRFGERGSFDILAMHERTGAAVAVEVKTRLLSLEATLRKLDEKARLTPDVAADRFGSRPRVVGRMLVLPEGGVARRVIARHDVVLRRTFPLRGAGVRAWLAEPSSSAGALLLVRAPVAPATRGPARRVSLRGLAPDGGRVAPGPHTLDPARAGSE
jgi:transcriptional regulator with XRE-family HTH domain